MKTADEYMQEGLPFFTNLMSGEKKKIKELINKVQKETVEYCEENLEDGITGLIIIHNSFDGREGVEWVNEILK